MLKNITMRRLLCVLILLSLCAGLLGGCRNEPEILPTLGEAEFDELIDELFAEWVSADSLSMNFLLADPDSFGIERPAPTFGEVISPESIQRSIQENLELSDQLKSFRYEYLRPDQQIIYDIMVRDQALFEVMQREEDYFYYRGYIRPWNGIQAQLPILLAEFNFHTAADIGRYLDLLEDTGRYFADVIEFERERSRRGFFMSDGSVDKVIENIEGFLSERDDNLLITVFNDRIDHYEGLNADQREQYKRRNSELIAGNVLPAYDMLLSAMQELRGKGAHSTGLANLPGGREYVQAYFNYYSGSDRTISQVERLLDEWMVRTLARVRGLLNNNPIILEKLENDTLGQIASDTPEGYLLRLKDAIATDFPPIAPTRHIVNEVHESLREHLSPALYLTPALDRIDDNIIYINPDKIPNDLLLFTVLAHESYPGHLYQTVYFLQQSPHPIRKALRNLGYDEGWATYAEMQSYYFAGLDYYEAAFLQNDRLLNLLLHALIDLGVNGTGRGLDWVASTCERLGIHDTGVVEELFQNVIDNPLIFQPYALGYIEISSLRQDAERDLRGDFVLLEFHRFILDMGSAPFSVISSRMQDWAEGMRAGRQGVAA